MKRKKILKITGIIFIVIVLSLSGLFGYSYYHYQKYIPTKNPYKNRVAHIDSENSLLSKNFKTCSDYIVDYYNYRRDDTKGQTASYSKNKNGLRKFISSNYTNKNYSDSGYLNIRFVINCKGETGRFIIHENNLDLEPKTFNEDLVNQLFSLTTRLKKWNPVIFENTKMDSYMYISYRIENGEITEILP